MTNPIIQPWQGFQARLLNPAGELASLWPLSKIVCVGRNYAAHALELNNPVPEQPLLFIKPSTSACQLSQPLEVFTNTGFQKTGFQEELHYETELALLVGKTLHQAAPAETLAAISGLGLALDLTLRETQNRLKQQGHPWEIAKAFDLACPLSDFVCASKVFQLHQNNWHNLEFSLKINGQLRQQGQAQQMLMPLAELLSFISHKFTLLPGDVVLTGTPEGVGTLAPQDQLELELKDLLQVQTRVV